MEEKVVLSESPTHPADISEEAKVLGSKEETDQKTSHKKFPLVAGILIVSGALLVGLSFIPIFKKFKKSSKKDTIQ